MNSSTRRLIVHLGVALGCAPLLLVLLFASPARADGAPPTGGSSNGSWIQQGIAPPPPPTEAMASAYDPVRQRLLVFGGYNGSANLNTLWSLSLGGAPHWAQLSPLGTPPSARLAHTMVYDASRDRMLVFGGTVDGVTPLSDVWALDLSGTPTWSMLTPAGSAPALFAHSAVYDPVRDRMLVFGGRVGVPVSSATWELSFAGPPTWSLVSTAGPAPTARDFTSAIYDPVGDRMVVFGGNADPGGGILAATNDTWSLSLAGTPTWSSLATAGPLPETRRSHAAVYDATQGRMIVYGGVDGTVLRGTTFALTLDASPTWSNISPAGPQPPPRNEFAFMFDPVGDRAIAFGGLQLSTYLGDTWSIALSGPSGWTQLTNTASGPGNLLLHDACYDSQRHLMYVAGGYNNSIYPAGLWSHALIPFAQWSQIDFFSPTRPSGRGCPALVYDPVDDRVVFFGGTDGTSTFNDTWLLDPSTGQWSKIVPSGTPPSPRQDMAFAYDSARNRMLLFGGWTGSAPLNELWALTLGPSPHWDLLSAPPSLPAPRYGASMVYDPTHDRLVLFGGYDNGAQTFLDTWTLNLSSPTAWTQVLPAGTGPSRRFAALTIYDSLRHRMVVFGGYNTSAFNDCYGLDLSGATLTWSPIVPSGLAPSPRDFTAGIYDPVADELVMYGGNAIAPGGGSQLLGVSDLWTLVWGDAPTPTLLSFADEQTGAGSVRLTWYTPDGAGERATAERSPDGATWEDIAQLTSDAAAEFVLADAVPAGGRFAYRLRVAAAGGEVSTDAHWVTIPVGVAFGITGTGANPSRGALAVSFALASAGPASLDLYDVRGRRIEHKDLGVSAAGARTIDLASGRGLASGVYVVRLSQGARVAQRKVAVVH